jgi:Xaa-Pro aminopeptidase
MDVFPRSEKTGYYGDLTRTVVRGKASFALHELYAVVHEGVRLGHRRIREGVAGLEVHREIQALFERQGYRTGMTNGRMQGFFHGTGHGVGLQIHEDPSVGKRPSVLKAGHVVTVEPGLYYIGLGGVRIEDMALVRKRDSRCLTHIPKRLEI